MQYLSSHPQPQVKMIQRADKADYKCASMAEGSVKLSPDKVKADTDCEVVVGFSKEKFYNKECNVLTMDGKVARCPRTTSFTSRSSFAINHLDN